jgi:NADP-dependent 3-hydroxy acid dehydrogenase YdfG
MIQLHSPHSSLQRTSASLSGIHHSLSSTRCLSGQSASHSRHEGMPEAVSHGMTASERYKGALMHPEGPGDRRPTALQIIDDEALQGQLEGCVALITGGAGALGTETAVALHAAGCQVPLSRSEIRTATCSATHLCQAHDVLQVVLAVKQQSRGTAAIQRVEEANQNLQCCGSVTSLEADLAVLETVRKLAADFRAQHSRLDIVINNAGAGLHNKLRQILHQPMHSL